jgi:hypothetical protein
MPGLERVWLLAVGDNFQFNKIGIIIELTVQEQNVCDAVSKNCLICGFHSKNF